MNILDFSLQRRGTWMARHHRYSKRSRESRKAMTEGADDTPEFPGAEENAAEDWQVGSDEPDAPPGKAD
jgi:hypothetical protein